MPTGHDAKMLTYTQIYNELYIGQNYGTNQWIEAFYSRHAKQVVHCHTNHEATCINDN